MDQKTRQINYKPGGPILTAFLNAHEFVRGIMGPLGSGKSASCCLELLRRSKEQAPSADGLRYTRWAVIRNSYPELKTTTIKTWFQWMPQEFGKYTQDSPITHYIKAGDLDMEVLFLALDREEDAKKLLSLELTGAWLNEAREINKGILDALTGRVGRYPSKNMGGCTWSGIIMDTNPPDDQSWWYKAAEEQRPKGWAFFKQPAGDSPEAENVENLPRDYYSRIKEGKDEDWVKVYVKGDYGFVTEGKAVYPMFRDRVHVAPAVLPPIPVLPLYIGVDFGLQPAAVIGQKLVDGRWHIIDEFIPQGCCGNIRFAESLRSYVTQQYPGMTVGGAYGDPSGMTKAESDERTAFELMKLYTGWDRTWKPAPSNEIDTRKEVVISTLNRMIDGNPGILISPRCKMLRKGFSGGYHYQYMKTGSGAQVHEKPRKNEYSHPHDALQYLLLGGGEYGVILGRPARRRSSMQRMARDVDYDVFK